MAGQIELFRNKTFTTQYIHNGGDIFTARHKELFIHNLKRRAEYGSNGGCMCRECTFVYRLGRTTKLVKLFETKK